MKMVGTPLITYTRHIAGLDNDVDDDDGIRLSTALTGPAAKES